jgi:hypothetical protein
MRRRIALAFHGIAGGMQGPNNTGLPVDIATCAKLIKKHLIGNNQCDVFVHTWSPERKDEIVSLYQPIACQCEPQEMFGYSTENLQFIPGFNDCSKFRSTSRFVSLSRAMQLVESHEDAQNFKYDLVMVLRLDLVFLSTVNWDQLDPSCIYLCQEPHWPNIHNLGMCHDLFFLSCSENMRKIGNVGFEILAGKHADILHEPHFVAYYKVISTVLASKILFLFERYKDVEIMRFVEHPEQNQFAALYGGHALKDRMVKEMEGL